MQHADFVAGSRPTQRYAALYEPQQRCYFIVHVAEPLSRRVTFDMRQGSKGFPEILGLPGKPGLRGLKQCFGHL